MTKSEAIDIAFTHLMGELKTALDLVAKTNDASIAEGWPAGTYGATDEPVWSIAVPQPADRIGGSRMLVISKQSRKVIFDGTVGE